MTRALDMLRGFQVEARRRADLAHRLDELATLWRNLGIAGALCQAHAVGLESYRNWALRGRGGYWHPGCGRTVVQ